MLTGGVWATGDDGLSSSRGVSGDGKLGVLRARRRGTMGTGGPIQRSLAPRLLTQAVGVLEGV